MSRSNKKVLAAEPGASENNLVLNTPSRAALRLMLKYYAAWLLLIWGALAIYFWLPYYRSFLSPEAKNALLGLAVIYTLAAPAGYWLALVKRGKLSPSRAYIAICSLRKLGAGYGQYLKKVVSKPFYPQPKISTAERTNLLFMAVKFFFLPLMIDFLFSNFSGVSQNVNAINSHGLNLSLASLNNIFYPFILSILLVIDTAYFTFGYAVESDALGNKVVSVDPTFLGWFSALVCYPPFNGWAGTFLPWHANDYTIFHSPVMTMILYLFILSLWIVYVAASVALGPKASNLTNRGIVNRWPYSFIRHPAYISKNLAWWLTLIPVLSLPAILGMAGWSFIYFLRAITEERHLMMADNGYREYAEQVRWRFIPRLI